MDGCLSEELVAALIAGKLPCVVLEATELHLDGCTACRELVAHALRASARARPPLVDVTHIGRYRVLREIGAGSMGRVYAAEDPDLGREVALKVLRSPAPDEHDTRRARLAREARAMARLAHPNVITVHEVGAAGKQIFIAMELVRGVTLRRWLDDTPRGWRAVTDVLCAAGRGLAAAHAAGIVHRDFKPDNVLVGHDGRVRVTDFGLARLVAVEATLPAATAMPEHGRAPAITLTASGGLVGTPAYMAPEQLRGDVADERSDLFSFCVTFWEALYGERPFVGRDLDELHAVVAAGRVRPPPEGRDVPEALQDVIRRGLHPAPGDRPDSMAQLLAAIDAAVATEQPGARPPPGIARMFGRARELEFAEAALRRARSGSGSLLLVTGEAGIGKSRLAREVAARATAVGMRVLWGRAWEAGGAMPYWPWVQVFRGLGASPFHTLAPAPGESAREERFHLFDAAARSLEAAARQQPLAILLEDLHATDLASLLLLVFVARQIGPLPVLLLATARELESRASPELADAMARIGREAEAISLGRLGRDDVAAWLADRTISACADEVYRVTEGNPLFVEEMLRLGGDGKHLKLSDGIRVVLDAHLARLAPDARVLLETAAVTGRQFGSRALAALAETPHDAVLAALGPACELGVVEAIDAEHLQFTHVLLRERLHQSLPVGRRNELHWKAGLLAEASGADTAACAHHLLEGVDAGDAEHAARAALRAAEQALHELAFESAIALGERALAVLPAAPSLVACQLEHTVGESLLRSGAIEAGYDRCRRAAELARTLGARDELARAALAYACEIRVVRDPVIVRLLEESRVALGPTDGTLAARVSARLSVALLPPQRGGDIELALSHAHEALAMARRLGDPNTLLHVLSCVYIGVANAMTRERRFEIIREIVELAEAQHHLLVAMRAGPDYATGLLEQGRRADADACLAAMVEFYAAHGSVATRWRLPMLRAAFALFDGDAEGSERLLDEALAIATSAGTTTAPFLWAKHRVAVAIAVGNPGSIARYAERVLAMLPSNQTFFAPFRTWVLAAIGRRDEAAALLKEIPSMFHVLHGLLIAAEACKLLEDRAVAAQLYQQIMVRCPSARFYWGGLGIAFVIGPVPRLLGELALLTGDTAGARRHFEESIELCRRIGARPFLELSVAALRRCTAPSQGGTDGRST